MEVYLQRHKVVDNRPKPTAFLFRENTLPILCAISHILTRAIRDDAIIVDDCTSTEPFFTTDLRGQNMEAVEMHWKPEWLKHPVFRNVASDAVRDQVMRHDPGTGVFKRSYINSSVRFIVQDASLGGDISAGGLTRAFGARALQSKSLEVVNSLLAADPEIVDRERRFKELYAQIEWEYEFTKRSTGEG
ncbi:MAG: hypothetical protein M1840_001950 [Geoglossum simile]|nr:MAG: hypothetical protein M1840_001950 [Geoglossum simile]